MSFPVLFGENRKFRLPKIFSSADGKKLSGSIQSPFSETNLKENCKTYIEVLKFAEKLFLLYIKTNSTILTFIQTKSVSLILLSKF